MAVLGAHPLEKTVDAFATAVMRLKGPLHKILLSPVKSADPNEGRFDSAGITGPLRRVKSRKRHDLRGLPLATDSE